MAVLNHELKKENNQTQKFSRHHNMTADTFLLESTSRKDVQNGGRTICGRTMGRFGVFVHLGGKIVPFLALFSGNIDINLLHS